MISDERIEEIAARLEASTPGPWQMDEESYHVYRGEDMICADLYTGVDADFIAHAPEDVAYLLAALAEAWQEGHAAGRADADGNHPNPYRSDA